MPPNFWTLRGCCSFRAGECPCKVHTGHETDMRGERSDARSSCTMVKVQGTNLRGQRMGHLGKAVQPQRTTCNVRLLEDRI